MRSLLKKYSPVRLIAATAFISIFIVSGLAIFVYAVINKTIDEQTTFATKIDVGGYQRMLSQRIAFYTTEYATSGNASDKAIALEAIDLLFERHQMLINKYQQVSVTEQDNLLTDKLQALYFTAPNDLNTALNEYVALARDLLNVPATADEQTLARLKTNSQQILEKFDLVVQQYEQDSNERIRKLSNLLGITFIAAALLIVGLVLFVIRPLLLASERLSEKLQLEARKDFMTGLHNRRVFPVLAEQAITMSRRRLLPVTLILFDIDDFKAVNDQYGHKMGDEVIRALAETIRANSRDSDETFRFGGDEFVMILPFTDIDGAMRVANNIRENVARLTKPTQFTVSGGVACVYHDEDSIEPALQRADHSLYKAKGQDKNRIEIYDLNTA
ncbi:GGDEF domain-containing protein [Glaciecola sp. XM2]|uniref:GGDEF domain-containing protein n=1 Tax=Glaciecola sp. XM2 TaxID=1914931 RepID=UPI001BDF715A|nr:GGDEF domain-containing protein [Glaciecola sp. XM2]MBT1450041.1 GGDEF domain-containing protein [Glaciecola sp. XM2]